MAQLPTPSAQAGEHYENFPVASWLSPPALRPAIGAIYRFARTADDIADEGQALAAERTETLARFRGLLREVHAQAASGQTDWVRASKAPWPEVFGPLAQVVAQHRLPLQPLDDLLDAFEQDVRLTPDHPLDLNRQPWPYPDRASLLDYCRRSANPVGRLMLHLYGVDDDPAQQQSDDICTGLQLVNFWQDLSVDLPRRRWYVPQADALAHELDGNALTGAATSTPAHANLVHSLADWALQHLHQGAPLVHKLPGRIGWELRLVVQGGLLIGQRSRALGALAWQQRPLVRAWDAPLLLWRALCM